MYKSYSASDYKKFLKLPDNYCVDGFVCYGTSHLKTFPIEQFENSLKMLTLKYKISKLESENLHSVKEIKVKGKTFWFTNAYGGAELSELLHWACLFGSKKNIHLGSCGGLVPNGKQLDLIIPIYSYGEESSAKTYQPDANNKYYSDKSLSKSLFKLLSKTHTVHTGPIVTCQATLAETFEGVQEWSNQGYSGVEMESATVFAVSNHFKVPSAAIVYIVDNLIKQETVLDKGFEDTKIISSVY